MTNILDDCLCLIGKHQWGMDWICERGHLYDKKTSQYGGVRCTPFCNQCPQGDRFITRMKLINSCRVCDHWEFRWGIQTLEEYFSKH